VDFLIDHTAAAPGPVVRDLWLVTQVALPAWLERLDASARAWLEATGFRAEKQQLALIPGPGGEVLAAALGLGALPDLAQLELWHVAGLPERLPAATRWQLANGPVAAEAAATLALGWAYGAYRYDSYKTAPDPRAASGQARLVVPAAADFELAQRLAGATAMARDWINMPASDMTPERLAASVVAVAGDFGAEASVVEGDALLEEFPCVHAVGRASSCRPRLVDVRWGDPTAPKLTIVGKGVCFDTGGLDLKPAAGMLLMKKDMGGAACATALARLVMQNRLRVRLRLLVPAVENAVAGNAFRPGDVLRSRKGLSVEIGNTDAEGRLILCDALAAADDESPDLLVDLATLTGAARVALGPELPALFGTRNETVEAVLRHGRRTADPLWPLPLWSGYEDDLASKIADTNNASASTFAGSIIGALYLKRFVTRSPDWLHVDLYAWNPKDRPGRPAGGEAQAVRALYSMLAERYGWT